MNENEVKGFLEIPNKLVIRPISWVSQISGHTPQWKIFESAIQIGEEIQEGFVFRARFQGPKTIIRGAATTVVPESFSAAIFFNATDRIAAIDTGRAPHRNDIGFGKPYFNRTFCGPTHRHIWTGSYGYAEPIEPPILNVVELLETFAAECNLCFASKVTNPIIGSQGSLPL